MQINEIKELIESLDKSSLTKLEVVNGDVKIKLEKKIVERLIPVEASLSPTPKNMDLNHAAEKEEVKKDLKNNEIKAPLVGVFYQAPSPNAKPYVTVGQSVEQGETVCIIEAMKVLNEIKAPISGIVKEIKIDDGDIVEFDQVLMEIGD